MATCSIRVPGGSGRDIVAALRNIVGGEIGEYGEVMTDTRNEALGRMIEQAEGCGADAMVGIPSSPRRSEPGRPSWLPTARP